MKDEIQGQQQYRNTHVRQQAGSPGKDEADKELDEKLKDEIARKPHLYDFKVLKRHFNAEREDKPYLAKEEIQMQIRLPQI